MIPWTIIKFDDSVISAKAEFSWKKTFRPFEGQEVELWCRSYKGRYSIEVWCYALKDFFESHYQDIPEAEKIVKKWLLTILLKKYKLDEDEWFICEHNPKKGWHKNPGGASFTLELFPNKG